MAATGGPAARVRAPVQDSPYAVELRGITKRFPGVVANRDIEPRVAPGRGARHRRWNGAGKSP